MAFFVQTSFVYAGSAVLKEGMKGQNVSTLQNNLRTLGFFNSASTGYFGSITKSSVVRFQKQNNLVADGIAGVKTLGTIDSLLKRKPLSNRSGEVSRTSVSQTNQSGKIELLDWFKQARYIFERGDIAKVTDLKTGLSFMVKRTYGTNHADSEALSSEDAAIMLKIAGGDWNWTTRPAVMEIDGRRLAASFTARPHAGRDDKPGGVTVSNRSYGYGTGTNLDQVKGNKN
jgi:hypothetical protein